MEDQVRKTHFLSVNYPSETQVGQSMGPKSNLVLLSLLKGTLTMAEIVCATELPFWKMLT